MLTLHGHVIATLVSKTTCCLRLIFLHQGVVLNSRFYCSWAFEHYTSSKAGNWCLSIRHQSIHFSYICRWHSKTQHVWVSLIGEKQILNIGHFEALPITVQQIVRAIRCNPVLSKVLMFTKRGWPAQMEEMFKPFSKEQQDLTVEGGCLMWGIRVIVPEKLQLEILGYVHWDHPGICRLKALARICNGQDLIRI